MSSKLPSASAAGRRSLGFRLVAWSAALFILGDAAVLSAAYLTLSSSLRRRDREAVLAELRDLEGDYLEGGVEDLRREATATQVGTPGQGSYFVRLRSRDGRIAFEFRPRSWSGYDLSGLPAEGAPPWSRLPERGGPLLELASRRLADGARLQVGRSSAERDDILRRFRSVAAAILLPTALLGIFLGVLLAGRTLGPVRRLIDAVRAVRAGDSGARVPVAQTADELEELGVLFNGMLDRIERLVAGMREALDAVAHDLRTPLARLRSTAEGALRAGADLASCREALADCVEEADRAASVLAALMDISEAESGALALRLEPVALDGLVEEAVELYRFAAEAKGVELSAGPRTGARALCDRGRLRQAVANLVDNAVKYTPAGGRVEAATARRPPEAFILVRDTGIGIPPEELPRIWERLFRGRRAREQRGLGLGLSLVRAVVEAHRGRVEASSRVGEGSVLTVSLAACEPETAAGAAPHYADVMSAQDSGKVRPA